MSADRHPPLAEIAVVMVPLPAQGHLNQLLHLSHRISAVYNVPVHYVSTATHLRQARLRLHGRDPLTPRTLHFHECKIPTFESPIPNPNSPNKFPSHLQPLFNAASHLRQPIAALLRRLAETSHRVVVIHDSMMSSVVSDDVVSIPNAESYIFNTISAFCTFWYLYDSLESPFPIDESLRSKIPSLEGCFTPEFMELIESEQKYYQSTSGNLFNACRVTEGKYLDSVEKLFENKKSWGIGPFNPVEIKSDGGTKHDCLKWLDNQEPKSVVYVSFGTTVSLPEEQIKELAIGLEESGLKFLWVLRDADRGDFAETSSEIGTNSSKLGFDFEQRGIVVRDWAPQLEILGHFAIGGFVSHCGWNSCMESLSMGIPVATWPMHSDQPRNAVLLTEVLGVGMVAKDWARRDEIVKATAISKVLRTLMVGEEGKAVRRTAEEIGGAVRAAEGGVTRQEMDDFIAHIAR